MKAHITNDRPLSWARVQHEKATREWQEQQGGLSLSDEEVAMFQRAYTALAAVRLAVTPDSMSPGDYSLVSWHEDDDAKMADAIYIFEQDVFLGGYYTDREKFNAEWQSGQYEPPGAMSLPGDLLEILGPADEGSPTPPPLDIVGDG